VTPTPPTKESSTRPQSKSAGKPRAKAGRRAKANGSANETNGSANETNGSAKAVGQPGQQAFVFEGLPTRKEKVKGRSSKRMATVANASTIRRSAASRVDYVQQELDLGA
jgi:hypothetical protein